MSFRVDSEGATYGYSADDHEYNVPTPRAWVASRTPDPDSFTGRGDWADELQPSTANNPDGQCTCIDDNREEDPCGEDEWPLERIKCAATDDKCGSSYPCEEPAKTTDSHSSAGESHSENRLHTHMRETFDRCLAISVAKNQDYASSAEPFKNFKRAEIAGVSVEQGILVRLTDKLCRIGSLLDKDAAVADEKLSDTIEDGINYLAILAAWLDMGAQRER